MNISDEEFQNQLSAFNKVLIVNKWKSKSIFPSIYYKVLL